MEIPELTPKTDAERLFAEQLGKAGGIRPEFARELLDGQRAETHGAAQAVVAEADVEPVAESQKTPEAATLARYKSQYDKLPKEVRPRCSWEELSSRLLANESHYLKLAMAMQDGGELVWIDSNGNPILRDGGVEPVMKGMSYGKTRRILYGKDYKEGTAHFGYEMPDSEEEIRAIERITGRRFVESGDQEELRATWMESGKTPQTARFAYYTPHRSEVNFSVGDPDHVVPDRGVVRLLRVKKMA